MAASSFRRLWQNWQKHDFKHLHDPHAVERAFQVILSLQPEERQEPDELARLVEQAVDVLTRDAAGTVLGVVGGADLEHCAIELEFTVPVQTPEELYERMTAVLRCLRAAGFEFEFKGSTEERVVPDGARELQPA